MSGASATGRPLRAPSVFNSRSLLGLWVLLLAAVIWLTRDAWADIIGIAVSDEEQSHILLVPIVAGWMAWIRRLRLRHLRPSGTLVGPATILIGWAMSYIGFYYAVQSAWHAGAIVMLVGGLITGLGLNTLFKLFPAFAVLVFAVPVPGSIRHMIAGPLQTASAAVTQVILETFGAPIERTGNLLTINGHEVAVAEACNGMRMVLALVLVSYAFAFSIPLRWYARAMVLIMSPLAALGCNVFRLLPTVVLYGYADEGVANSFHDVSGWLMVPLAFCALLGLFALLRWALIPVTRFTLAYQ